MFKAILVPTDGSTISDKAISAAVDAAKQSGGRIVGISVVEPYPFPPMAESAYIGGSEAYEQRARELAQEYVSNIDRVASAAGVPCQTSVIEGISPHEEIVAAVDKFGCDSIFMATHGRRGLNRLFVGSETQKVIANASVPVTVIR